MIRQSLIAALCCTALVACESQTAQNNSRAITGAAGGAAIGALAGLLVGGDDRRNALVGAGIGLLAGAAVGSYLDDQQRALEQDLEGSGATVDRVGDKLLVSMPAQVTFLVGKSDIQPQFYATLTEVAGTLKAYPESYIDVIGHTDSTGSDAFNQTLSEQRAGNVQTFLISQGVSGARLVAIGRGETSPIASNDTEEGRQANRRVEIVITPATAA